MQEQKVVVREGATTDMGGGGGGHEAKKEISVMMINMIFHRLFKRILIIMKKRSFILHVIWMLDIISTWGR